MRDRIEYDSKAREHIDALTQSNRDALEAEVTRLHAIALQEVGAFNAASREGRHRWGERSDVVTNVRGYANAQAWMVTWCAGTDNYTRTTSITLRLRFHGGALESRIT
jgi:hypothetical protein